MDNSAVCFTGHRVIEKNDSVQLEKSLKRTIEQLISEGYTEFKTGGALGFDTIAAVSVIKLKRKYKNVRLTLIIPCKTQSKSWRSEDRKIYDRIKNAADSVICISDNYFNGCMQIRNRKLVEGSAVCICYLNKKSGGTYYTVKYASSKGLKIINLSN